MTRPRLAAWWAALALFAVPVALFAVGESAGWPWLAGPLERRLASALERPVSLGAGSPGFRLRLVGGLRLEAGVLDIGAPAWSHAPGMLQARGLQLALRWGDLWRAWQGGRLQVQSLRAQRLDVQLERLADGRASWQPPGEAKTPAAPVRWPAFEHLQVDAATLVLRDALWATEARAEAVLDARGLQATATGTYRGRPLQLSARSGPPAQASGAPLPFVLHVEAGRARLDFAGESDLQSLAGRYSLHGPSLAAVGDPFGVTLPTTGAFRASGGLVRRGGLWQVLVDEATVGRSSLTGAFTYDTTRPVPRLAGRLRGQRLLLADLGPVVGSTAVEAPAGAASAPAPAARRPAGRVLPGRPFDLAALRVMDAAVLIDIAEVDVDKPWMEPLRPLRGVLQLTGGVLSIEDIDARLAQGGLQGMLRLDGRGTQALWSTDLRWQDVRLEQWLHPARSAAAPPYASGRLDGTAQLQGQGRSTAEILGSLSGRARTAVRNGSVSHLAVELAGLDLAQSLGVLLKGDDALPLQCAVADLVVQDGVFRPRRMMLDTRDSTIWVDGSLSLATETMDLRAVVSPKDFSPLSLRSPLRVHGALGAPEVSFLSASLGRKVAGAVLLALINPLAGLLPLVDTGSDTPAASGCDAITPPRSKSP